MGTLSDRPTYRPSGRVNLIRFGLLYVVVALPLTLFSAFLLYQVFVWGFYLLFLAPVVAGLLASAGVALAVHAGLCRNRWLGAAAGLLVGAVTFLGYYHFHLLSILPPEVRWKAAHRVDVLPRFVYFRVLTDEQKRVGDVNNAANKGPGNLGVVDLIFKWFAFAMDGLAAVAPGVAVGWALAARPFSERHRRWLKTHVARLTPPFVAALKVAFGAGKAPELAERLRPMLTVPPEITPELRFEYLPDAADSPVYLTATLSLFTGKNNVPKVQTLLGRVLLTPEETDVLAAAVSLPRTGEAARPPLPAGAFEDKVSARVEPLPAGEAGKVLTSGFVFRANVLGLSPLLLGLAVAGLVGWLAYSAWDTWGVAELAAAISAGVLVVAGALIFMVRYEQYLPTAYQHRRLLSVLRGREEHYVDPDDPEALCVEVIPRANWGKVMAQTASDVGLLKVDRQRRAVLFEGDRERWVIPAESILACEVEEYMAFANAEESKNAQRAIVVLVANVEGRPWEAPVVPQNTAFRPWTIDLRRELAKKLQAAIAEVMPPREG